jgi:hypothetical protein
MALMYDSLLVNCILHWDSNILNPVFEAGAARPQLEILISSFAKAKGDRWHFEVYTENIKQWSKEKQGNSC